MKEKLTDHFKSIITNAKQWAILEVEYAKLTVAETFTILSSAVVIGFIALLLLLLIMILLSFALVYVFSDMMAPWLACITVPGIVLALLALIIVFKKPLLTDPIAKFITTLIIGKTEPSNEKSTCDETN